MGVDGEFEGLPGAHPRPAATRAVHSDLPPASAVTVSSSSSWCSDALARLACSTGGASIVKMTWISPRNQRARSSSLASQ
jgi:hypothetical protein